LCFFPACPSACAIARSVRRDEANLDPGGKDSPPLYVGLIEAVRALGGGRWTLVREVLVPEALPGLAAGFTVTLVTLIGASAIAGAVGFGGLGDLAIRYRYQRFETQVMIVVVIVLIALVSALQVLGDTIAVRLYKSGRR